MQEAQRSVLSAIEENQNMMSHVANHIGQNYYDGRTSFLPPEYIQDENYPPSTQATNSTITSQNFEMNTVLKGLASEIKSLKTQMSQFHQQSSQSFCPFNPNLQQQGGGGHHNGMCEDTVEAAVDVEADKSEAMAEAEED